MHESTDFSTLVRRIRDAGGLTQEQLARELDVTFATVNAWENARHRPLPSLARRLLELAARLGIETPRGGRKKRPRQRGGSRE